MHTRSGSARRAAGRSDQSRCPNPGRTRCWSAPYGRASAAAPKRWYSAAACPPSQYEAMRRRTRRGSSPVRSSTATSTSASSSGTDGIARPYGLLPVPPPDRLCGAGRRGHSRARGVPSTRAVLAGTVETAVNASWDARPLLGDRVTVVGAGMVGCCVARLLARFPAFSVALVDVNAGRADVAAALGVDFALPADAADEQDLVVHASATSAGLQRSLELLAPEGTVIDLSWYGDREVRLSLGAAFQRVVWPFARARSPPSPPPAAGVARGRPVGARARPPPRPCLRCPSHRAVIVQRAARVMARLDAGSLSALCHTITYDGD